MRGDMRLPTSIIELEEGGWILRYSLGGWNGKGFPGISADLGLIPRDADSLAIAIREIAAPNSLLWQESGVQDPGELLELEDEEEE